MAWLIAIICLILVVYFWRVLLPIALAGGVIVVVIVGAILLYLKNEREQRERQQMQAEQATQEKVAKANAATRERIAKAKLSPTSVEPKWEVSTETDPASGESVPRIAGVMSDDGLCRLQVEQHINGTRLSRIRCPGLTISPVGSIEVKFDNRATSDAMRVSVDRDDLYIPSSRSYESHQLQYDEFLQRMPLAKKVALLLTIEGAGSQWIAFSLAGSGAALIKIGAIVPRSSDTQQDVRKRPLGTQGGQSESSATRRTTQDGVMPSLPAHAELNYLGDDWKCVRGYRRSGNECAAVRLPSNAELNYLGDDWKCVRGYRRSGSECVPVGILSAPGR